MISPSDRPFWMFHGSLQRKWRFQFMQIGPGCTFAKFLLNANDGYKTLTEHEAVAWHPITFRVFRVPMRQNTRKATLSFSSLSQRILLRSLRVVETLLFTFDRRYKKPREKKGRKTKTKTLISRPQLHLRVFYAAGTAITKIAINTSFSSYCSSQAFRIF